MSSGEPTIGGHNVRAISVANDVWHMGVDAAMDDFAMTKVEVLVAIWFLGLHGHHVHGGARYHKRWKEWAEMAGQHLWFGCIGIEVPPNDAMEGRPG